MSGCVVLVEDLLDSSQPIAERSEAMPTDHDYEPDTEAGAHRHGMQTDPPCRVCGGAKRNH